MNARLALLVAALGGLTIADTALAQSTGPSSSSEPYMLPVISGVSTTSILTTGDAVPGVDGPYRLAGTPDGMGVWMSEKLSSHHGHTKTFNAVNNHEFARGDGVLRAHGSTGSFVAQWKIDARTLKVLSGRDHMTSPNDLYTWNGTSYVPGTSAFERFCSGDLADEGAYSYTRWIGTTSRIHLNGEETTPPYTADHGRAFAHVVSGPDKNRSFELPRLGKMSFENAVASPYSQRKTIVMLNDDANAATDITNPADVCPVGQFSGCKSPPSELFMYVGEKQGFGNTVQRAGLTNGRFYGVQVKVANTVVTGEDKTNVFGSTSPVTEARFGLVKLGDNGDVSGKTGVEIEEEAISKQVTQFIRIEDGAWDPRPGKQNDYYFVTTGKISSSEASWLPSRLWRVRFDDIRHPERGGTIKMVLTNQFYAGAGSTPDDDPSYQMFDNMAIDGFGRIVLQEDVGGNDRLGRMYVYGIDSGDLVQVGQHNPDFFKPGGAKFLTTDEESSAVVDAADILGKGWFLFTVQNHLKSNDPELVEGGQLVAMYIDPKIGLKGRGGHHHDDDHGHHGHGGSEH
jgi:hypothetical protein